MKITPRPTLFQITAALAKSGHSEMARELANKSGVDLETLLSSRVAKLDKPKYVREKVRFAYLFPKKGGANETEQQELITAFVTDLRETDAFAEVPAPSEAEGNLLCVVLPGNKPIWSYKIELGLYKALGLDRVISDSQTIGAYVRKPRADVQGKLSDPNHDSTSKAR